MRAHVLVFLSERVHACMCVCVSVHARVTNSKSRPQHRQHTENLSVFSLKRNRPPSADFPRSALAHFLQKKSHQQRHICGKWPAPTFGKPFYIRPFQEWVQPSYLHSELNLKNYVRYQNTTRLHRFSMQYHQPPRCLFDAKPDDDAETGGVYTRRFQRGVSFNLHVHILEVRLFSREGTMELC